MSWGETAFEQGAALEEMIRMRAWVVGVNIFSNFSGEIFLSSSMVA
jgi:hypothetical protein